MKITEIVSITELSRLLGKSRPTVYKYVSDFEKGNYANVPHSVKKLFLKIQSGEAPKREIYEYCQDWFVGMEERADSFTEKKTTLKEVVRLLKENEKRLDLTRIKNFINEEIGK